MVEKNHIEHELKLCLSEADYLKLCEYLVVNGSLVKIHEQRNVYLETEDRYFAKNREMLRLRETESFWTLTHKSRIQVNNGEFSSQESEIDFGVFEGTITELLKKVQVTKPWDKLKSIKIQGELLNTRHEFEWGKFTLELDRSQFSDYRVDFELECETSDFQLLRSRLTHLFDNLKIPWEPQESSKYKRFLETVDSSCTSSIP